MDCGTACHNDGLGAVKAEPPHPPPVMARAAQPSTAMQPNPAMTGGGGEVSTLNHYALKLLQQPLNILQLFQLPRAVGAAAAEFFLQCAGAGLFHLFGHRCLTIII